jgi:hypothetical protein
MKTNTTTWILAIVACAALAVLTGCPDATDGPGGNTPSGDPPATAPTYIGKYTLGGNAGRGEVVFELDKTGSARAAADSNSLSGRLKDPSGVRQLRGIYDPASGAFNLSADGSGLHHGITGTFGTDGKVRAANALVYNKSKTDSTSLAAFPVAQHSGPISGGGAAMTNPLLSEFMGKWSGSVAHSAGGDGMN